MDILQRRLLKVGEPCFFIRASVEEPFIYLRFGGIIKEVTTYDEHTTYRIMIAKIYEDYETIMRFMNRVRFRVKNQKDGKFIDKYFYTYDLHIENFDESFVERFSVYTLDVPAVFVFENMLQMQQELENVNRHINDKLVKTLKHLGKRINEM